MTQHRSAWRGGKGGKGVGHNQPEGQPVIQTADPTALITHANLISMEQSY